MAGKPIAPTTIAVQESNYPLKFNQQNRKQQLCCHATIYLHQCLTDRKRGGWRTAGVNSREEPGNYAAQFAQGGANGLAGYPTTSKCG